MAHDRALIARIKGALRVLKPKQLSYLTGISVRTIHKWSVDERHAAIEADESAAQDIRDVLMGRFLGDPQKR
jgi:hypothetical protein